MCALQWQFPCLVLLVMISSSSNCQKRNQEEMIQDRNQGEMIQDRNQGEMIQDGHQGEMIQDRNQGEMIQDPIKFQQLQTDLTKSVSHNFLSGVEFDIPEILLKLLSMAWDEFNPNSLNNQINDVYEGVSALEQQLAWLEYAIFYGEDIKTLDYLIKKYNQDIQNSTGSDAIKWADVALGFDSNGFDRSLKDIGDMMEGTDNLFVKGSIFEAVGSKAETSEGNAKACVTIQQTWNYLTGLWVTGHAVWAQAYRIKNDSFEYNAGQKKIKAESRMEAFQAQKDAAFFKRCDYESCYQHGLYYDWEGAEYIWKNVSSAKVCNNMCMTDENCKLWTSDIENNECFSFANEKNETKSNDSSVISGPKVCFNCEPTCNVYFCDLHICGDVSCCRSGAKKLAGLLVLMFLPTFSSLGFRS